MTAIVDGTNGVTLPVWTTATRPSSPSQGQIGYNSTLNSIESYSGLIWSSSSNSTTSTISDVYGNVRTIPQSGSDKTTSYTLATTDVGRLIGVGTGGSVTIPDATFSTGDVVSIFNNTTGNITITCTITTAYIGGVNTDKATVTLATRGVATILFISGTVCVINGNVS